MEKLRQLCVYSINPHRISPFYFFKSHLPLILITAKNFITLHSCKLFLKTLKYYLVTCWFISLVGSPPGVVPPILAQVYCVTDGFTRPVRVERWGPWKGSVLHWQRLHGQLKLLVDRVTHSTSLLGVVFPVENVFLFGSGKVACPGFWNAAPARFSGLDLLVLMAKDTQEKDSPPLPERRSWHSQEDNWALPAWLIFTSEVTTSKNMQKWTRMF